MSGITSADVHDVPAREINPSAVGQVDILLVGVAVFGAALFGILTRPVGFLATVWPANALLLGLMVRHPRLARPAGWIITAIAFITADLLTGSSWWVTVWMTAANLAGVAVGFLLFRRLSDEDRGLQRPLAVLYLLGITCVAAIVAALIGCGAESFVFGRSLITTWTSWFASDVVNGIALLPVILTAPSWEGLKRFGSKFPSQIWRWIPLFALVISLLAGMLVGGPGAIAFPVPVLLWCAISYSIFTTSILTLFVSIWTMIVLTSGTFAVSIPADMSHLLLSVRLGVTLLALGPIAVASVNETRNALLEQLHRTVTHDHLTGALTRSAFATQGTTLLEGLAKGGESVVAIMCDVDLFKRLNDTYGHATGDRVLSTFAQTVRDRLGDDDLFGRVGGDEFAILLPRTSCDEAKCLAERIRTAFSETAITLDYDQCFSATASFGVAIGAGVGIDLDSLLLSADQALYCAKAAGRDQVVATTPDGAVFFV